MRVRAIISDFDGTLCPTSSINPDVADSNNPIPSGLEDILCAMSKDIPICIVSSKDFYFLYERVKKFSNILSCVLGMETLFLDGKDKNDEEGNNAAPASLSGNKKKDEPHPSAIDNRYSIISRHLLVDYGVLFDNSAVLNEIVSFFEKKYPLITIEKKFLTANDGILAGITIDWRNDSDWNKSRKKIEAVVRKSLFDVYAKPKYPKISNSHFYYHLQKFFVQKYSTHPFIDIYSTKTSKEDAYDCIVSELIKSNHDNGKIIYLGDSENDNPAFKKADISIGINSDDRLKPDLKCKYNLKFDYLPAFLKNLATNNFEFSESLLSL